MTPKLHHSTPDEHRSDSGPMTPDAFAASLERSAGTHPPSKARRIAALLPHIEAAMAQGSTRAHVVTALLDVGIKVTPQQLSNVLARLRRQRHDAAGSPVATPPPSPGDRPLASPPAGTNGSAVTKIPGGPTLARSPTPAPAPVSTPAPPANAASKFGAHDPRLLDEVMRSTPDMRALARLAPKPPR